MSTLADLTAGQQFLFACEVTAVDGNGISLGLYGPGRVQAATALIAPSGLMSGQLAAPPDQVPVTIITGFAPVSVGDVMANSVTGETMVCRWSSISPDGTVTWASSASAKVIYRAAGWTVIGHVTL